MPKNLLGERLDDVLRGALDEADEGVLLVDPSADTVEALVDVLAGLEEPPTVQTLAHEDELKGAFEDFIVASNAADHVEHGTLSLRVIGDRAENTLLVTDDRVLALVATGSTVAGLAGEAADLVDATGEKYHSAWEDADEYTLRTPALSAVRTELGDELDSDVEGDFTGMLDSLETARGDGDGLDEVTLSLLAAAKNESLLYDISRWGEDVGLASKATFSRTKTNLEDEGLIETEKVPIDVGRPRLRLKLGDERLQEAEPDQLATAAQSILN